jgi:hypothetical protein
MSTRQKLERLCEVTERSIAELEARKREIDSDIAMLRDHLRMDRERLNQGRNDLAAVGVPDSGVGATDAALPPPARTPVRVV